MKKRYLVILLSLLLLFSCSSTQFNRIHKDIEPQEKEEITANIEEITPIEEEELVEEDLSQFSSLYRDGVLVSKVELSNTNSDKEEVEIEDEIVVTPISEEKEVQIEEKRIETRASSINSIYYILAIVILIILILILLILKAKKKKGLHPKLVESNTEQEDNTLYIDRLIKEEEEKGNL